MDATHHRSFHSSDRCPIAPTGGDTSLAPSSAAKLAFAASREWS